jgi:acetyl esterase
MTASDNPRDRLHPQSRAVVDWWYEIQGGSREYLSVADAREITRRCLTAVGPPVGVVTDVVIDGPGGPLATRVYQPPSAAGEPPAVGTLLFLHGGGWVLGSLDGWDAVCREMTLAAGCNVVSLDYRLAPESPFPAAVDDTWEALTALDRGDILDRDLVGPIAVGGMSAGGNLAAVACLLARHAGGPEIAYQLLVVPVCDCDLSRDSYRSRATDLGLEVGEMRWFWDHYLPNAEARCDWRASPLRAEDHAALPPASVVVADCDPLVDEGVAYAEALHAAGVDVVCSRWYGMHHGFFGNAAIDGGAMALASEARRLRTFLDRAKMAGTD